MITGANVWSLHLSRCLAKSRNFVKVAWTCRKDSSNEWVSDTFWSNVLHEKISNSVLRRIWQSTRLRIVEMYARCLWRTTHCTTASLVVTFSTAIIWTCRRIRQTNGWVIRFDRMFSIYFSNSVLQRIWQSTRLSTVKMRAYCLWKTTHCTTVSIVVIFGKCDHFHLLWTQYKTIERISQAHWSKLRFAVIF